MPLVGTVVLPLILKIWLLGASADRECRRREAWHGRATVWHGSAISGSLLECTILALFCSKSFRFITGPKPGPVFSQTTQMSTKINENTKSFRINGAYLTFKRCINSYTSNIPTLELCLSSSKLKSTKLSKWQSSQLAFHKHKQITRVKTIKECSI